MSTRHTQEPWKVSGRFICSEPDKKGCYVTIGNISESFFIDDAEHAANAARVVAAVNACAGMADPEREIAAMRAENARLREALTMLLRVCGDRSADGFASAIADARTALTTNEE